MDFELSVPGSYIVVRVNVPMTVEVGRQIGPSAVALAARHHINKFLFDMRKSPNIDKVYSNYEFARKDMAEFGFSKDAYSAFLVHPEDHSHDFITSAFESAGYKVRIFTEENMAIKWLEIKGG